MGYTFDLTSTQTLNLKYRNAFSRDFLQSHNGAVKWTIKKTIFGSGLITTSYYFDKSAVFIERDTLEFQLQKRSYAKAATS